MAKKKAPPTKAAAKEAKKAKAAAKVERKDTKAQKKAKGKDGDIEDQDDLEGILERVRPFCAPQYFHMARESDIFDVQ